MSSPRHDDWTAAWSERYAEPRDKKPRRRRPGLPASRAGRWSVVCSLILALGISSFAVAQTVEGGKARFASQDDRYTMLARNTRDGDGGAGALACNSNTGNESCLNMVNKGNGFAAAFRTRGLTGFRLQTSGTGTATPFLLDPNATGKVEHLNADTVDGRDSSDIGRERWALVDGDATPAIVRSNGAVGVTRAGPGDYRVQFNGDVSQCTYQVTSADVNANRTVAATGQPGQTDQVQVSIRRAAGAEDRVDGDFQISVDC